MARPTASRAPGSTTLTRQPDGSWSVASSFNVGYSISFVGAQGSKLSGLSGTTQGTVTMQAGTTKGTGTGTRAGRKVESTSESLSAL